VVTLGGLRRWVFKRKRKTAAMPASIRDKRHRMWPVRWRRRLFAAMTDSSSCVRDTSYMSSPAPTWVKTVTNEVVTAEELAAPASTPRNRRSPTAVIDDDVQCRCRCGGLIDFLPFELRGRRAGMAIPRRHLRAKIFARYAGSGQSEQALRYPRADHQGGGRGRFLRAVAGARREYRGRLRRIAGRTVGFVANQPIVLAGRARQHASRKAARFVRFCDASTSRS